MPARPARTRRSPAGHVVELHLQAISGAQVSEQSVVAPPSLAAAFIGEPQQYSAIALCGRVDFAALGELRQSVRARGLEEPQARLGVIHIRRYERFRYELRHLVDNLAAREHCIAGHRRGPEGGVRDERRYPSSAEGAYPA